MDLFKNISLRKTLERLSALLKRFPFTLLFVLVQTIFIITLIQNGWDTFSDRMTVFIFLALPTSALLTLSFHLFNEERTRNAFYYIGEAVILLAWIGACFYFTRNNGELELDEVCILLTGFICIFLSVFTLSFIRRKNDLPFWHFTTRTISAAIIAGFIGLILCASVSMLILSLEQLFGLKMTDKVYTTEITICMSLITPVLFLMLIPEGDQKQDYNVPTFSKFYRGVIQYLFIPLLICYFVTLYLYALNIIIHWELPKGWVSGLVTTLMVGMLTIIFLLYPQQYQSQLKRIERFALHVAPLLTLPVLVLMSVGIFRRISDYGITVPRLYLLLFNLWCYLACIILLVKRTRNIWWLPVSFGVLAFLASIGPWSFSNLTKSQMRKEVRQALIAYNPQLPLSQEQYREWFLEQGENAKDIASKLVYLKDNYPKTGLKDILADSVFTYSGQYQAKSDEPEVDNTLVREDLIPNGIGLPLGYNYVKIVERGDVSGVTFQNDSVFFTIGKTKFGVRCQELLDELKKEKEQYTLETGDAMLVFDFVRFNPDTEALSLSGLLFTKEPIKK
jgi:hypothetical protein